MAQRAWSDRARKGRRILEAREKQLAYVAWVAVCLFWGTTYLAIRIGVTVLPPLLFNGLRVLAAGVILAAALRKMGQPFPVGREWLQLGLVGVALLGIGNGMVSWSAQWLSSGLMALLVAMTPFWMVGMEALGRGGDRPTLPVLGGLLLGCCGLALLVGPELRSGFGQSGLLLLGCGALQVGCAAWAAGSIYARRRPVPVDPLMGAAIQMIAGGVTVSLAGTLAGEWSRMHLNPQGIGAFLYLLVFGSIVGYSSYVYALQKLPVGIVSLYAYVNPVIAVLLGWMLLGERLSWREGLAVAVILGGVALVKLGQGSAPAVQRRERRSAPTCEAAGRS
jgi:drug/metabolite transporter (DMT)-like permease